MMVRWCLVVGVLCAWTSAVWAAPALSSNPPVGASGHALSDTGYYALSWAEDPDQVEAEFVVEESLDQTFSQPKRIYKGPDLSTAFSGRLDGEYFYRVRAGDGPWSDPLKVIVQHHSLKEAVIYLAIGAVVFLATAVLVIAGHIGHRRDGLEH